MDKAKGITNPEEDTLLDLEAMAKADSKDSPQAPAPESAARPILPSLQVFGIPDISTSESFQADLVRMNAIEQYSQAAAKSMEPTQPLGKALSTPPSAFSFANMSYMPDPQSGGLLEWPGIAPGSLQKLARTNLAPEMIISTRVSDVLRYSGYSSHPWKPGWRIELKDKAATPTSWDRRDIRACEAMLENCSLDGDADTPRKRDAKGYCSFKKFLAESVRDYLTYDAIAIWTDLDQRKRIKGWVPMPAGNIRLASKMGYLGNKDHFAVLIDQGGTVVETFTRDNLIWHPGHPKVDPDWGGYGWSRLDCGMRLIDGFQAAFDVNADIFSKNSFPTGMMLLKGSAWSQNELDLIARQIANLKKGVSKQWAMPAMVVPKDNDIDFLDLNAAKDKDTLYQSYMNLILSVFCMIYQFPYRRFGFRVSDNGADNEPLESKHREPSAVTAEEDIGLINLLSTLEHIINTYIIATRFPHLQLTFSGKAPREDAREYESRQLSLTYGEKRAQADQPNLEDLAKGDSTALKLAKIMNLAPVDPGLSGIFQALASSIVAGGKPNDPKSPQAEFSATKDPAKGEQHGALSGVRRHSPRKGLKSKYLETLEEDGIEEW